MSRKITEHTIKKTLQGESGNPLDYCFAYQGTPQAWDPVRGGFRWYFVDDDLFIACAHFLEHKIKRAFSTLEELRAYGHLHNWENLPKFDLAIDQRIQYRQDSVDIEREGALR